MASNYPATLGWGGAHLQNIKKYLDEIYEVIPGQGLSDLALDNLEVGGDLAVGPIELPEDAGAFQLIDMPVEAAPIGTEESYAFAVDGTEIFKIYAESDGVGGIQNYFAQADRFLAGYGISNGVWFEDSLGDFYRLFSVQENNRLHINSPDSLRVQYGNPKNVAVWDGTYSGTPNYDLIGSVATEGEYLWSPRFQITAKCYPTGDEIRAARSIRQCEAIDMGGGAVQALETTKMLSSTSTVVVLKQENANGEARIGFLGAEGQARQPHIADADGTLADITTKFNSLLTYLEDFGLVATI
ncbi:MAG: hypothetical protein SVY53_05995 [Chloroflexota bacterium]|nr:hypothetical protein [Chloroflexota bacterium]